MHTWHMPEYGRTYEQRRLALIERLVPTGTGRALDIGCNDGTTTALLAAKGYTPLGVDVDADAVERARRGHPGIEFEVGTVEDLPAKDRFDLVTCLEVIEHLTPAEQDRMLAFIRSHLTSSGALVLSTPGRYSIFSLIDRSLRRVRGMGPYDWWDPTHRTVLSCRRLHEALERHELRVERLVGFHYLPAKVAPPFSIARSPLNRAGFDLIVCCRPATGAAA